MKPEVISSIAIDTGVSVITLDLMSHPRGGHPVIAYVNQCSVRTTDIRILRVRDLFVESVLVASDVNVNQTPRVRSAISNWLDDNIS